MRRGLRVLAGMCLVGLVQAQPSTRPEVSGEARPSHVVKAEYLVHFLDYVERPGVSAMAPEEPWIIAVNAADEVHAALLRVVRGKVIKARSVQVRLLSDLEQALERVHVLYLNPHTDLTAWTAACAGRPLLVVTDDPHGIGDGPGIVNFLWVQDRVRFEVSLDAAERAGLKVSARMLQVAHRVTGHR